MLTLPDFVLEECRLRASLETTEIKAVDRGIAYVELLTIKYEIELCYAEKRMLDANPLLRYIK